MGSHNINIYFLFIFKNHCRVGINVNHAKQTTCYSSKQLKTLYLKSWTAVRLQKYFKKEWTRGSKSITTEWFSRPMLAVWVVYYMLMTNFSFKSCNFSSSFLVQQPSCVQLSIHSLAVLAFSSHCEMTFFFISFLSTVALGPRLPSPRQHFELFLLKTDRRIDKL